MKPSYQKLFRIVLLPLCFMPLLLTGIAAEGGEYTRPDRQPPTDVDLVTREGDQKTIVVQIINLTPYDIQLKDTSAGGSLCAGTSVIGCPSLTSSSVSEADQGEMMNRDRETAKAFMFAPVGIPRFIPKTPVQAFEPPTNPDGSPNPKYDPNYYNTETRPYAMVFSWDDHKAYVEHSWVKWTVKNVEYCTWYDSKNQVCPPDRLEHQDVDLGLWMDRVAPETSEVSSGYFSLASGIMFTSFHTLALFVEWENPMAWVEEAVAVAELAKGVTEFVKENGEEAEQDAGAKIYLASYPIPSPPSIGSQGTCGPQFFLPATSPTADDAVDGFWGTNSFDTGLVTLADTELVVSTQILRGLSAPNCPDYPGNSKTCDMGRLPIYTITVRRTSDWHAATLACLATPGCGYTGILQPTSTGVSASRSSSSNPTAEKINLFLHQAGAGKIMAALKRTGRGGLLSLAAVLRALPATDRQVLRDMLRDAQSGRLPTKREREVVHWIGAALDKRLK